MTLRAKIDPAIPTSLREVVITKTFDAPRALVWQAWTEPKHIQEWWGPHGYDAVKPTVDLRVGGEMNFDMRAPNGAILPGVGIIRAFKAPEKLVISTSSVDAAGDVAFEVLNTIELYGNTTAATVPLTIDHWRQHGKVQRGDRILSSVFGSGFTWGAAIFTL